MAMKSISTGYFQFYDQMIKDIGIHVSYTSLRLIHPSATSDISEMIHTKSMDNGTIQGNQTLFQRRDD